MAFAKSSAAPAAVWFGSTVWRVSKQNLFETSPRRLTKCVWADNASMALLVAADRMGSSNHNLCVSHGCCGLWSSMQSHPSRQKPGGSATPYPVGYSRGFFGQPLRIPGNDCSNFLSVSKSWPIVQRKQSLSSGAPSRRRRALFVATWSSSFTGNSRICSGLGCCPEDSKGPGSARRRGPACRCSTSRLFFIQARFAASLNGSR
mmetsp:Transcript_77251/g.153269  ORF Transcript_77251/g.153269 Transcript_77251/m.153269 type:complete len:204 (-) Transcript_77251:734-1345(-)